MNEDFKKLVGKQTIYLGNLSLIHELGDFFNITNNTGGDIHSLWRKICYRLNNLMKEDKDIVNGKIKCCSYFGKQDRELWHKCYWIKEQL